MDLTAYLKSDKLEMCALFSVYSNICTAAQTKLSHFENGHDVTAYLMSDKLETRAVFRLREYTCAS